MSGKTSELTNNTFIGDVFSLKFGEGSLLQARLGRSELYNFTISTTWCGLNI
jgi:hypothetical protein